MAADDAADDGRRRWPPTMDADDRPDDDRGDRQRLSSEWMASCLG